MRTFAFCLQFCCLLFTGSGVLLEILSGAKVGLLLITLGSVTFAVSVKINKMALIRKHKNELLTKNKDHD